MTDQTTPTTPTGHHRPRVVAISAEGAAVGADAGMIMALYAGAAIASSNDHDTTDAELSTIADAILRHTVTHAVLGGSSKLTMLIGTYLGRWCDLLIDYVPDCGDPEHAHGDTTIARFTPGATRAELTVTPRSREVIAEQWAANVADDPDMVDRLVWCGQLVAAKHGNDDETYGRLMGDRLAPLLAGLRAASSEETGEAAIHELGVFLHGVVTIMAMTFGELQSAD